MSFPCGCPLRDFPNAAIIEFKTVSPGVLSDDTDADLVIRSKDGHLFPVYGVSLAKASLTFVALFALPPYQVADNMN